ncbi:MAG: cytochrome c [Deltaproteobacteria bacterium]|nr:cytochrome c [Deltaproteobacteria bacterium]
MKLKFLKWLYPQKIYVSKIFLILFFISINIGCSKGKPPLMIIPDMDDQQKVKPQTALHIPPEETVARGSLEENKTKLEMTPRNISRGDFLFQTYCMPCHGNDGEGNGPVVQRGYIPPPPLITGRVKGWKDEEIYNVIAEGQGTMPSYKHLVSSKDRQAIISYLRKKQSEAQ